TRAVAEQQIADRGAPVAKIKLTSSLVTDAAGGRQLVEDGKLDALVDDGQVFVKDAVDPKLAPLLAEANLASQVPNLDQLQEQAVGIVALWFLVGYIFYASAYAAVAARVSRQEEMQSAVQPLNLLIMVPYFAAFAAIGNPDATWVRALSLIPPFSVLIQPVRI